MTDFRKVAWYLWQLERCVPNLPGLWDLDRLGCGPIHLQWIHRTSATCFSGLTASKNLDQLGDVLVPWKANLKPTFSFYKVNEVVFQERHTMTCNLRKSTACLCSSTFHKIFVPHWTITGWYTGKPFRSTSISGAAVDVSEGRERNWDIEALL